MIGRATQLPIVEARLRDHVSQLDKVAVAFSGGVDSSYLLAVCVDVLCPDRVLALTVDSPLLPRAELDTAGAVARQLRVPHRLVPLDELGIPEVAGNLPRRCYHCKRARLLALLAVAKQAGGFQLVQGENADDRLDYRPGSQAAQELRVPSPLAEVGLTKAQIREFSRRRGLLTWNQPAAACLATRFPHHTPLTRESLQRVERAERLLHGILGSGPLRVRDHDSVARIEASPDRIARLAADELRAGIAEGLRRLGYRYVTLDLDGYRTGSMNVETDTSS